MPKSSFKQRDSQDRPPLYYFLFLKTVLMARSLSRKQVIATVCLLAVSVVVFRSLPAHPPAKPATRAYPKQTSTTDPNKSLLLHTSEVKKVEVKKAGQKPAATATATDKANNNNCNWRPEPLQGPCDTTKSTAESQPYKTAVDCEKACCQSETCVTFQFRAKEGCLWGADTRLGAEKDNVSAWCEPRAPAMWQGQWIKDQKSGVAVPGACSNEGWNPKELGGQCFGLGSKKTIPNNTPEACRDACCNDKDCKIWEWRKDAGCFYNNNGYGAACQEANPEDFEKFIGKRKVRDGRLYEPYAYSQDFADLEGIEKQ